METLEIKNFGGIKHQKFAIKPINIYIGEQAAGKSVVAKLIYFCKGFTSKYIISLIDNQNNEEFDKILKEAFYSMFPMDFLSNEDWKVKYQKGKLKLTIDGNRESISIKYPKEYAERNSKFDIISRIKNRQGGNLAAIPKEIGVEDVSQIFIDTGRLSLPIIDDNRFTLMRQGAIINPIILELGEIYSRIKNEHFVKSSELFASSNTNDIIHALHKRQDSIEYLEHQDGRKVKIAYASSGQQEALPLVHLLNSIKNINNTSGTNSIIYIEEPEAHLFPKAQKSIVELIATAFNSDKEVQFVITTHSPYILTSFNNLIQAGITLNKIKEDKSKLKKLYKIISEDKILKPDVVTAYSFAGGKAKEIMDKETELINAQVIDEISNIIDVEFDNILGIENDN